MIDIIIDAFKTKKNTFNQLLLLFDSITPIFVGVDCVVVEAIVSFICDKYNGGPDDPYIPKIFLEIINTKITI